MIKNCIFFVLIATFLLPVIAFAQESNTTSTLDTNTQSLGFPSLKSVKIDSAPFASFNVELLQDSYSEKKHKNGRILRNVGMGFTITSIVGGITGLVLGMSSIIPLRNKDIGTAASLAFSGAIIGGTSSLFFLPGIIMWPIGASMLK